jgi:hypothetical protein
MKDPRDILRALVALLAVVAVAGASLGINVSALMNAITEIGVSLFVGAVLGSIAWAIARQLTGNLPRAFLAGGTTTAVVATLIEVWLNAGV